MKTVAAAFGQARVRRRRRQLNGGDTLGFRMRYHACPARKPTGYAARVASPAQHGRSCARLGIEFLDRVPFRSHRTGF